MENYTAKLDCIKKIVTFCFNDEIKQVDLTEGDLDDSWNYFEDKNGIGWNTSFTWENHIDSEPNFSVYGRETLGDGSVQIDSDAEYVFEIVEQIGTQTDYFKLNNMKTELRVYLIEYVAYHKELSNEEFMEMAEEDGRVFTLDGFQECFNEDNLISSDNDVMRIIEVAVADESDFEEM